MELQGLPVEPHFLQAFTGQGNEQLSTHPERKSSPGTVVCSFVLCQWLILNHKQEASVMDS